MKRNAMKDRPDPHAGSFVESDYVASNLTDSLVPVKKFGKRSQRNPNRCAECGGKWAEGVVKSRSIKGKRIRLCAICCGKMR